MVDPKLAKAALKEGGKKGIDLVGMEAMGGVHFFCLSVESAGGCMELLEEVLKGANKDVDPEEEEQKGGAKDIGKIFLSAGDKQLAILAHVPEKLTKKESVTVEEWMNALLAPLANGADVEKSFEGECIRAVVKPKKDHFPLKLREEAISASFEFLRQKGLVPPEEDSDDEYVDYAAAAGVEW